MGEPRVAVVYRLDHPGGVQSCAISIIRGLNRLGITPEVLWDLEPDWAMLEKHAVRASYRALHFPVPSRRIDRLPYTLRYPAWIANVIREEDLAQRYDFYYLFYNGFLVPPGVPHLRYLSGPPLLPQLDQDRKGISGIPIRSFRWFYRNFLRESRPVYEYHPDSTYVINSQYTADLFAEAHGVHLPVIHPPIDLTGLDYAPDDLDRRDTLTFFSRIVPYKRPEMILELAAEYPSLRCVVMGGVPAHRVAYFEGLKVRAAGMGLNRIVFLANPARARVREELSRTRFFVFTGVNEHFGMTTAEAIASGAIPFVHDSGGQREIVTDPRLRFQDEQFSLQFSALVGLPDAGLQDIRRSLREHMGKFSEERYLERMLAYLYHQFPGVEKGAV